MRKSPWPVGDGRERILFGEPVVISMQRVKVGFGLIGHHPCGTPHSPCLAGCLEALPHLTSLQLEAEATQAQDSLGLLLRLQETGGGKGFQSLLFQFTPSPPQRATV